MLFLFPLSTAPSGPMLRPTGAASTAVAPVIITLLAIVVIVVLVVLVIMLGLWIRYASLVQGGVGVECGVVAGVVVCGACLHAYQTIHTSV